MINKIVFKFGSAVGQSPLSVDLAPITVFVGPNNSGKSRILVEIEQSCRSPQTISNGHLILQTIEFMPYTEVDIKEEISNIELIPVANEVVPHEHTCYRPNLHHIGNRILFHQKPTDYQPLTVFWREFLPAGSYSMQEEWGSSTGYLFIST